MSRLRYRPEIDGLRAVAVSSVVAFHADLKPFSGGYIGVDVFFVVSGFLIGMILLADISSEAFSALEFYKRRALRIAPALLVMLIVLTVVTPFVLFPGGLSDYAASARSVLLSVSNFYFASRTNYFSDPYSKPLLHTWSLGVEEQFYIILPLVLLAMKRMPAWLRNSSLTLLMLGSLAYSQLLVSRGTSAGYYLPIGRSWELLLGTLVSCIVSRSLSMSKWVTEVGTALGLTMILVGVRMYTPMTAFPGVHALLPCVGTALILLCGAENTTLTTRILAIRPLRFLGLISYSWYLWHWPIVSLLRMGAIPYLPYRHRPQAFLIITLSAGLAILSWRYVETPFRSAWSRRIPAVPILSSFACAGVLVATLGFAMERVPSPFPAESLAMARYSDQVDTIGYRKGLCYIGDPFSYADYNGGLCLAEDRTRPDFLVLGDSHAAAAYSGLRQEFTNVNFLQATAQGCKPLRFANTSRDCQLLMRRIFEEFLPRHHLAGVLLIGRWLDSSDTSQIDETVRYLQGLKQRPILVGPSPEFRIPLPRLMAYSLSRHDPSLPERYQINDLFELDGLLAVHARADGISYVSPLRLLCPDRHCIQSVTRPELTPLLFDSNHFTVQGAILLAAKLKEADEADFLGAPTPIRRAVSGDLDSAGLAKALHRSALVDPDAPVISH
jgi:peptidoglycan/LPS O-acetylase OafA/YrhL